MNKKLTMLYGSQNQEKERYEEQLKRMQEEIAKMCDLISELSKQKNTNKKKKRGHSKCSKKQKIIDLEK